MSRNSISLLSAAALSLCLGCVSLPAVAVVHDDLGKPGFAFTGPLAEAMQGLTAHLSISDEADYAIAYVILEQR